MKSRTANRFESKFSSWVYRVAVNAAIERGLAWIRLQENNGQYNNWATGLGGLALSALVVAMIAARWAYTGRLHFYVLCWNLFLAWVPFPDPGAPINMSAVRVVSAMRGQCSSPALQETRKNGNGPAA